MSCAARCSLLANPYCCSRLLPSPPAARIRALVRGEITLAEFLGQVSSQTLLTSTPNNQTTAGRGDQASGAAAGGGSNAVSTCTLRGRG